MYMKHVRIFVQKITILSDLVHVFWIQLVILQASKIYNTNYEKQKSIYKNVKNQYPPRLVNY